MSARTISLAEYLERMQEKFQDTVKPLFEAKDRVAIYELMNLVYIIKTHKREIVRYHSGHNLLATVLLIEQKRSDKQEIPKSVLENFEAHLAQLTLSVKAGNN